MRCGECDREIEDGSRYCPWCGATSSFVPSLLSIALSTSSEAVAFAAFRVLARFFWDSMKEGSCMPPRGYL